MAYAPIQLVVLRFHFGVDGHDKAVPTNTAKKANIGARIKSNGM